MYCRFMVTKKEYESASETDDEPEPVKEKEPIKSEKVRLNSLLTVFMLYIFRLKLPKQRKLSWLLQELRLKPGS